jgi:hypothetical protein
MVRSTPPSFVGSGYGVSFWARYSLGGNIIVLRRSVCVINFERPAGQHFSSPSGRLGGVRTLVT